MAGIKSQEEINAEESRHNVSTTLNYYPADAGSPIPVVVGKYVVYCSWSFFATWPILIHIVFTDAAGYDEGPASATQGHPYQSMSL